MLDTSNLSKFLKGITDALRAKKGTTEPIEHKFIDEEIASIESGNPYQILQDRFFYSGRTNFANAFANSRITYDDLNNLVLDTSEVTNFNNMFYNCSNLTTIPQLDTSKGENFGYMFGHCSNLITIPQLDTSKGNNFGYMFYACNNLITIPQLDTSKGENFRGMFTNCHSLENISFVAGCIKKSISFVNSPLLSDESIQSIIDGLADSTGQTAQTITLHTNVKLKLTQEQIAQITSKNWTLA